jgi:DNA-binding CsgD family transcriptional regulator
MAWGSHPHVSGGNHPIFGWQRAVRRSTQVTPRACAAAGVGARRACWRRARLAATIAGQLSGARGRTFLHAAAVGRLSVPDDEPTSDAMPAGLSAREIEVLRLLTAGRTDSEIADVLFISRRTAATHVRHIYDKLGVSSRAEAAAWAVRHDLA